MTAELYSQLGGQVYGQERDIKVGFLASCAQSLALNNAKCKMEGLLSWTGGPSLFILMTQHKHNRVNLSGSEFSPFAVDNVES